MKYGCFSSDILSKFFATAMEVCIGNKVMVVFLETSDDYYISLSSYRLSNYEIAKILYL